MVFGVLIVVKWLFSRVFESKFFLTGNPRDFDGF